MANGNQQVDHGGVTIATDTAFGALRTAQSAMHQRFVRGGAITNLRGTQAETSSGSSRSETPNE